MPVTSAPRAPPLLPVPPSEASQEPANGSAATSAPHVPAPGSGLSAHVGKAAAVPAAGNMYTAGRVPSPFSPGSTVQALSDRLQLVLVEAGPVGVVGARLPLVYTNRHHLDLGSEVMLAFGHALPLNELMRALPFVAVAAAVEGNDVLYTHTAYCHLRHSTEPKPSTTGAQCNCAGVGLWHSSSGVVATSRACL